VTATAVMAMESDGYVDGDGDSKGHSDRYSGESRV
jgi:hypothetical protein